MPSLGLLVALKRAFANSNAITFSSQTVSGGAFHAKGEVQIFPGQAKQMNFLFARTAGGFYSLAITAGQGFTLFDHRFDGNVWRVLERGKHDGVRPDVFVPFSLAGKGRQLELELAGESWQLTLPRPLPDEIGWGVGAQSGGPGARFGSSGVWRGVRVRGR